MNAIRTSLLPMLLTVLAVGCGGGSGGKLGGGKEGAAKAMHQLNRPAKGENSGFGRVLDAMAQTNVATERVVQGEAGGKAIVKETVQVGASGVRVDSTIQYVDFSEDGKNRYNGSLTDSVVVDTNAAGVDVAVTSKGHVDISGEISDSIDADVTLKVGSSEMTATTGSVSLVMNGTIITSSGNYSYANETINFSADGALPEDDSGE